MQPSLKRYPFQSNRLTLGAAHLAQKRHAAGLPAAHWASVWQSIAVVADLFAG